MRKFKVGRRHKQRGAAALRPGMASSGASSSAVDDACKRSWRDLIATFHSMDNELTLWMFTQEEDKFYPLGVRHFAALRRPFEFLSLHVIDKRLMRGVYADNRSVLRDFMVLFSTGIRYNFLPGRPERTRVVACAEQFFRLLERSHGLLVAALAREGGVVVPFWRAFPGAVAALTLLEDFHRAHAEDTYPLYLRDGMYDEEEGWEDPADYLDYVAAPVYLSDVFERLLAGVARAPVAGAPARVTWRWYASYEEVREDVLRTFDNARVYYAEDEEVCARLDRLGAAWDAHWGAWAPRLAAAAAGDAAEEEKKGAVAAMLRAIGAPLPAALAMSMGGGGGGGGGEGAAAEGGRSRRCKQRVSYAEQE